jgi:hypothetical protein
MWIPFCIPTWRESPNTLSCRYANHGCNWFLVPWLNPIISSVGVMRFFVARISHPYFSRNDSARKYTTRVEFNLVLSLQGTVCLR